MSDHPMGPGTVLTGRVTNWPMILVSTALAGSLVAMGRPVAEDLRSPRYLIVLGVLVLAVAANALSLSSLRTAVGPHGVSAYFGAFGLPRFHYPVSRIRRVVPTHVPASRWAWGITWTRRHGLTLSLRAGPAIELELVSGRKVTVGVSDADHAVRVLAAAGCTTD